MPGENQKVMILWALQDAEDQGLKHHDIGRAQQVQDRSQVRLEMFKAHSRKSSGCVGENAESAESAQRKRSKNVSSAACEVWSCPQFFAQGRILGV